MSDGKNSYDLDRGFERVVLAIILLVAVMASILSVRSCAIVEWHTRCVSKCVESSGNPYACKQACKNN